MGACKWRYSDTAAGLPFIPKARVGDAGALGECDYGEESSLIFGEK